MTFRRCHHLSLIPQLNQENVKMAASFPSFQKGIQSESTRSQVQFSSTQFALTYTPLAIQRGVTIGWTIITIVEYFFFWRGCFLITLQFPNCDFEARFGICVEIFPLGQNLASKTC